MRAVDVQRFPARGPFLFWNWLPLNVGAAAIAGVIGVWWAASVVLALGIGVLFLVRRVFAVELRGAQVLIGPRFLVPAAEVVAVTAIEHRWMKGRPLTLTFCFSNGSTKTWRWLSYSRSIFANLAGADVLTARHLHFLRRLAEAFAPYGTVVDVPGYRSAGEAKQEY